MMMGHHRSPMRMAHHEAWLADHSSLPTMVQPFSSRSDRPAHFWGLELEGFRSAPLQTCQHGA